MKVYSKYKKAAYLVIAEEREINMNGKIFDVCFSLKTLKDKFGCRPIAAIPPKELDAVLNAVSADGNRLLKLKGGLLKSIVEGVIGKYVEYNIALFARD